MLRLCFPEGTHLFALQALAHILEVGHQKETYPSLMICGNISLSAGPRAVPLVLWKSMLK